MRELQGILMKSIGGFYYVRCEDREYECKARGSFRKSGSSPVVGDRVKISVPDDGFCALEEILPRKNKLKRPALANIDVLVIVCSTVDPKPNEVAEIYRKSGIEVFQCAPDSGEEAQALLGFLRGKVSAFTGNSGVGKSTLLNMLFPKLELQTGQISEKLGRGRHTTRVVELFEQNGCYVADTPGFSTVDLQRYEMIDKERLQYCFPEFEEYLGQCRFTSCAHICEKGCAVLEALKEGKIALSRHKSYVAMYEEVKDLKPWQFK